MDETLTEPKETPAGPVTTPRPPRAPRIIPWISLLLAVTGAFAAGFALRNWLGTAPPEPRGLGAGVVRLAINLPSGAPLAVETHLPALAISPRGERLVYVARRRSGTQLYVRQLDQLEASPVPGTDGATCPFFSPDGDWVAFFADGKLKKVPLRGGDAIFLCETGTAGGGSWSPDGTIYFVPSRGAGLYKVSASGGRPQVVSAPGQVRQGAAILWPEILPGGRSALVTLAPAGRDAVSSIGALLLPTAESVLLAEGSGFARYAPTGHLVYVRAGALLAAPFDLARLRVAGKPVPLLDGVLADPSSGSAQLALSGNGTLVYAPVEGAAAERSLLWVDRTGGTSPVLADRRDFDLPRLSPDGRHLAVSVSEGRRLSLWIFEPSTGTLRRLPSEGSDGIPLWAPDGRSLTYISPRAGAWSIFRRPADGSGAPELLVTGESPLSPSSWSPDGRVLLYTEADPKTRGDIWILAPGRDRRPRPLLRTQADEWGAVFSPDGRAIAYTSDESGRNEVYVQPFQGPGERRQVSREGGYGPIWSRTGSEIFYRSGDSVLAESVTTRPALLLEAPRVLFEGRFEGPSAGSPNYDVTPDGRRFVMVGGGRQDSGATRLNVVLGWFEEMKRRVQAAQE